MRIQSGSVSLRCWWAPAPTNWHDIEAHKTRSRVVIVLPEVFGVNAWIRSVVARLVGVGVSALAMPLFARTAPDLDLGYSDVELAEGRRHKAATTTHHIQQDVASVIGWLQQQRPGSEITVVGFCFGGHAALVAATHPQVVSTFDFYGAGVSRMRPGGGPPALDCLPQVSGRLLCLCGTADALMPVDERLAIRTALMAADPSGQRLRYEELEGADHGFMCEARDSFDAMASRMGWQWLLEDLSR